MRAKQLKRQAIAQNKQKNRGNQVLNTYVKQTDWYLVALVLVLVIFGCVMVYSASMYSAEHNYGDAYFFLKKQVIGAVLGLMCMCALRFVPYTFLYKVRYIALIVSVLVLVVVLIPGVGKESYGARRWINLGFFTIQASEIAKFGFIIFTAGYLAQMRKRVKTFVGILPVLCVAIVLCGLIMLEPNMSITMCMVMLTFVMLFVGGIRAKHVALLSVPTLLGAVGLILAKPYRMARLMAFLNPWASVQGEGFQLVQSLYALGSGGWFGVGLFNSRQKYLFLPFSESDFIFSIIGEELGWVGCLCVLAVFMLFILRGIKIALKSKDRFGTYLATGITAIIAIQVVINVAVVTGSIPPTGLPLPFISSGSSALIVFMSAMGVLLNISANSQTPLFTVVETKTLRKRIQRKKLVEPLQI